MTVPTLSVVMPNFNDADYMTASLEAICQQSFKPMEVIVIDNCSTDNSIDVIKQIAAKYPFVRLVQNETNHGPIYSANKGAKLAQGDYFFISSTNDVIYPGFFEKSMELLTKYPQAGLSCTDFDVIYVAKNKTVHSKWIPESGYFNPQQLAEIARLSQTTFSAGPNSIIRRDLLSIDQLYIPEIGGFGDWFLSKVIVYRYGCCYVPEPLVAVTWSDDSYWNRASNDRVYFQGICDKVFQLFASPDYEDIAPLIIRSRSMRNIKLSMRTPLAVFGAIYSMSWRNHYANVFFLHLVGEYFFSLYDPYVQKCRPVVQNIYDAIVSGFYFMKNLWDRAYAKVFHEYYKIRCLLKKKPGPVSEDRDN